MNKSVRYAILMATQQAVVGKRTFVPVTTSGKTDRLEAVKVGFIPMQGGDTPGGLVITVLCDVEDKLLGYFLLGGTADNLTEDLMAAFMDDDKVIIVGTDLNNEVKVGFMVDKFDRQLDQVISFTQFENTWGIEKVIQETFSNAKLYDTLGGG